MGAGGPPPGRWGGGEAVLHHQGVGEEVPRLQGGPRGGVRLLPQDEGLGGEDLQAVPGAVLPAAPQGGRHQGGLEDSRLLGVKAGQEVQALPWPQGDGLGEGRPLEGEEAPRGTFHPDAVAVLGGALVEEGVAEAVGLARKPPGLLEVVPAPLSPGRALGFPPGPRWWR